MVTHWVDRAACNAIWQDCLGESFIRRDKKSWENSKFDTLASHTESKRSSATIASTTWHCSSEKRMQTIETWHVDDNCCRDAKDVQSWALQLLSHACSRDAMWSCCATLHVLCLWVLCSHLVGCLEVFLQATVTCRNSEKNHQMLGLRIPLARLPLGLVPRWRWWRSFFAGWPAILTKLSAGFPATLCRTSNLFFGSTA